jgi:hypothetical protein
MQPVIIFRLLSVFVCHIAAAIACAGTLPSLKVSENKRFLVTADGQPFFWLGDTAWELFHRLDREQARHYLNKRASQGYTVIQAVALAEFDGLDTPNAYGHRPLLDHDPARPDVKDGPENDYWDHVDWIVREANQRGLYIGFLPTWGDKWNKKWGRGPEVFTPANAAAYGEWLGRRYQDAGVVWILGGDRPIEKDAHKEIIRAMANGLRRGDGGAHLITWHPMGGESSAQYFHGEDWLDLNLRQNGHTDSFNDRYERTREDYDRKPTKPVLDAEPLYEGHPINFKAGDHGYSVAADIRRPLYWDLFSGACGHTYGHHSVWQMFDARRGQAINNPLLSWREALDEPGAVQMQHGKHLLLSRPFLSRIPDDAIIVPNPVPTSVPGAGRYRFTATRDTDGTYAMVYVPVGRAVEVRMNAIKGPLVNAWWFSPRDGTATAIGQFPNKGTHTFTPPTPGEVLDWVLVLDDAGQNYPPPGQSKHATSP